MKPKVSVFLVGLLLIVGSVINLEAQAGIGFSEYAIGGTAVNTGTNWAIIPADLAGQQQNSQGITVSPHPVVNFLAMRGLAASGTITLQTFYSTNMLVLDSLGASGNLVTNFVAWPNTNGFAANTWCVLKHAPWTNSVTVTNVMYGQTNIITSSVPAKYADQIADEAVYVSAFGNGLIYTTNTLNNWPVNGETNSIITTNLSVVFQNAPLQVVHPNDQLYVETPGAAIAVLSQGLVTTFPANGLINLSGERRKPMLLTLVGSAASTNTIDSVNATFVP